MRAAARQLLFPRKPDLDLNFALGIYPPMATFARATSENAFNAPAILTSFGNNAPAFPYDPVSHVALGTAWFGQITNKCTNFNANPTDLTGVTLAGGTPTGTVVSDTVALTAAGLQNVVSAVYDIDNTAGATSCEVRFSGTTGNTNPHSVQIQARSISGSTAAQWGLNSQASAVTLTTAYQKFKVENITPGATTRFADFTVAAGARVRLCLNQLEENTFATPVIVVSGAAATRNTDVGTVPLNVTNIPANPVGLTIIGKARTAAGFSSGVNQWIVSLSDSTLNNRLGVYRSGGDGSLNTFVTSGGVNGVNAVIYAAPGANSTDIQFWATYAANDFAGQVIGQAKATDASGAMPTGMTTIGLGSLNSASSWNSTIARLIIYNRRLPDAQAAAIAASL